MSKSPQEIKDFLIGKTIKKVLDEDKAHSMAEKPPMLFQQKTVYKCISPFHGHIHDLYLVFDSSTEDKNISRYRQAEIDFIPFIGDSHLMRTWYRDPPKFLLHKDDVLIVATPDCLKTVEAFKYHWSEIKRLPLPEVVEIKPVNQFADKLFGMINAPTTEKTYSPTIKSNWKEVLDFEKRNRSE